MVLISRHGRQSLIAVNRRANNNTVVIETKIAASQASSV